MIDLHMHSTFSDGSLTPAELVRKGHSLGLSAMALTDHDTIDGVSEFLEEISKFPGMIGITGSELSARYEGGNLHILALNIKDIAVFSKFMQELKEIRKVFMENLIDYLKGFGFDIDYNRLKKFKPFGSLVRFDIIKFLMNDGQLVGDFMENYNKYFEKHLPECCKRKDPEKENIIENILKADAIPVLAHPCQLKLNDDDLHDYIKSLVDIGLKGIECYHSDHTKDQIEKYLKFAKEFNLIITAGSDFHFYGHKNRELGSGVNGNVKGSVELLKQFDYIV